MIYLDVSTTVNCMASFLTASNITVVTNSIDTVNHLMDMENVNIHILGGELNKHSRYMTGFSAMEKLKDYHFDKVLLDHPVLQKMVSIMRMRKIFILSVKLLNKQMKCFYLLMRQK